MKFRIQANRYFESVDEFSFIKQIGVGSFGSVRLALHLLTNKCYAVKVIDLSKADSQNEVLLLEREINLHSAINHPHIVKLWDTLIQNETVYMIMELAENGTLFNYQNKHPRLSEAEAFKFFSQSLSAIKYMHQHDIMHRDLKPENILLDGANNIKICDLGWATDKIQLKRKTFCGTYEYMAPEMVFDKEYDFSIDVWAVGILLYQLLHGYAPFPAKNIQEMRDKLKEGFYQLGIHFSEELKNLIVQILQFEPEQRPSISKIFANPWIERMRKGLKNQINQIKCELESDNSNRAKVNKQKGSLVSSNKKHKRFDSLAIEQYPNKKDMITTDLGISVEKLYREQKKNKMKKKCKTQGEQSIEKLFTQSCKGPNQSHSKLRKEKENFSHAKLMTQLGKTTLSFKNDLSGHKMKKITDKLQELTNKCTLQKKKGRFKLQKQQIFS